MKKEYVEPKFEIVMFGEEIVTSASVNTVELPLDDLLGDKHV